MIDYRRIAGCIRLAADRLKRDNDLAERNAMKPRSAEDLAMHFRQQDEADFEAHGYADQVPRLRELIAAAQRGESARTADLPPWNSERPLRDGGLQQWQQSGQWQQEQDE